MKRFWETKNKINWNFYNLLSSIQHHGQCDRMARLVVQYIWPLSKLISCPKGWKIWQSMFKIFPNIIKKLPKTLKIFPKWQNFAKSGHTCIASLSPPQLARSVMHPKHGLMKITAEACFHWIWFVCWRSCCCCCCSDHHWLLLCFLRDERIYLLLDSTNATSNNGLYSPTTTPDCNV